MHRLIPLLLLPWAADASAHAFAQRYDLPLPLWHYLAGAGATVALTFVVVAWFMRMPSQSDGNGSHDVHGALIDCRPLKALPGRAVLLPLAHVFSVAIFALVLAAGFFGARGEPEENLLPLFVWVIWWVGLTFVCALLGNAWLLLNPWAILARWARAAAMRWRPVVPEQQRQTPETSALAASAWPGVLLFLAFAWMELVWPHNAVPVQLALAVVAYSLITWVGMAMFGIEGWLRRGEAFSIYFGLMSRFAPLKVGVQGCVALRPYAAGLLHAGPQDVSRTAFVLLVLATVGFDGLKETPWWADLADAASGWLYQWGILSLVGNVGGAAIVKTAGLLLLPLVFAGIYGLVCRAMAALASVSKSGGSGRRWHTTEIAGHFVLSLVPIAIAYHLAHYLSFLLINGQALIPLLSDPLGRGWDLFGTRGYEVDIGIVDAQFVWNAALIAIVAGHIASLVVAHAAALRLFCDRRTAFLSQVPMAVLMVGYTMFSLWVLSQPVVEQ